MAESTQDTLILTSWDAVATFYGVSRDTVRTSWKSRGMPCQPGGGGVEGHYDVREISRWLAERLRNAGAWTEPSEEDGWIEGDVSREEFLRRTAQRDRLESIVKLKDWRLAIVQCITDYWTCEGGANLGTIIAEIWLALEEPYADGYDEHDNPLTMGGTAIRIKGSRAYIWAGLDKEFAASLVGLVNSGLIRVEAASNDVGYGQSLLDFPEADLENPRRGDESFPVVFTSDVAKAVPMTLEAVHKPNLQMSQRYWFYRREEILDALGDFEAMGLMEPSDRLEWLRRIEARVKELKAEIRVPRRNLK